MKRKLLLLILCAISFWGATAQDFVQMRSDAAAYIRSLQYTDNTKPGFGAFRKGLGPAVYDASGTGTAGAFTNTTLYMVEPYFTHIAAIGLLAVAESNSLSNPNIAAVRNWMNWYISKVEIYPQDGDVSGHPAPYMSNYYYDAQGGTETDNYTAARGVNVTRDIDAEDSDPTLFFIVANKYFQKTGDATWFNQANVQLKMEGLVRLISEKLLTPYNMTNAKRSWAFQYTMDNSEVYAGMKAFLNIESTVYGNSLGGYPKEIPYYTYSAIFAADGMANSANNIPTAISTWKMYPLGKTPTSYLDYKLYFATGCDAGSMNGRVMYDFTPTIWPALFGVDPDINSVAAQYSRNLINTALPGWYKPDWTLSAASGGFWDVSVGYFFTMSPNTDDQDKGKKQAANAASSFKPGATEGASYIADAGWQLLNLQVIITGDRTNYKPY